MRPRDLGIDTEGTELVVGWTPAPVAFHRLNDSVEVLKRSRPTLPLRYDFGTKVTSTLDEDPSVDVTVATRGGGADKQLRVFNEPPLCRVIHRTTTPVVAAVGHETDRRKRTENGNRETKPLCPEENLR